MLRSGRIGAMRDVELYRAVLGLTAPWTVVGVDVDLPRKQVVVRVDAGAGPYPCPECATPGPRHEASCGAGSTWTRCSSRPGSRPTCRGWTVAHMGSSRCGCPGPSRVSSGTQKSPLGGTENSP